MPVQRLHTVSFDLPISSPSLLVLSFPAIPNRMRDPLLDSGNIEIALYTDISLQFSCQYVSSGPGVGLLVNSGEIDAHALNHCDTYTLKIQQN